MSQPAALARPVGLQGRRRRVGAGPLIVALTAVLAAAPASAQRRFAETCQGSEVITATSVPPTRKPFALTFSADLDTGYVCYGACTPAETFAIRTSQTNPITLADVHSQPQDRLVTFDRTTSTLVDRQTIRLLGVVKRDARATCRPSAFHEPPIARIKQGS